MPCAEEATQGSLRFVVDSVGIFSTMLLLTVKRDADDAGEMSMHGEGVVFGTPYPFPLSFVRESLRTPMVPSVTNTVGLPAYLLVIAMQS